MQPLKIQIAFQGGGAKIVSLLAAAEVIQNLHRDGKIQVTRVAGTSAGAIVACLLASGKPLGQVKAELQRISKEKWKELLPAVSKKRMVWNLLRDEPFWSVQPLRDFLATFFEEKRTLGDLKKASGMDLFIIAADVTNSKKWVYSKNDDPIVNSLMDSCALPFVLRTAKNSGGQVLVDGGICENLPSEELEAGAQEFGQVVAVSFDNPSPGVPPENVFKFGLSLLETSINNSTQRTRRRLGDHAVFGIDTKIGTFDFDKALTSGLDAAYENVKYKAEKFFEDILAVSQGKDLLLGDPWQHGDPEIMAKLSTIYNAQHEPIKLEYLRSVIMVQANCLLDRGDPRHSQPDLVKHSLTFRPAGAPVHCHKLALSSGSGKFLGRASWSVQDKNGEERETVMLPIVDPQKPSKRELLLFFDPVIREDAPAAPFTVTFQDLVLNSMGPLNEKEGRDSLSLTVTRAAGDSGRIDLILLAPSSFPKLEMSASALKDGSPGPQGRPMESRDLNRIDKPPGFIALGWTGTSPRALLPFGVDFRKVGG